MIFEGVEIRCPKCGGELSDHRSTKSNLQCLACHDTYPVLAGIPDLRVFSDPYIHLEEDRAKGMQIASKLNSTTFAELVDFYYSTTSAVPPQHAKQYSKGLLTGEARARVALAGWEQMIHQESAAPSMRVLEIGCGTAPLLVAATSSFSVLVGIDIAFRWLVMAKKRLLEAGIDAPILCACAEALPFPNSYFHRVIAESSLEHMRDQRQVMKECYRVLVSGGYVCVSTPNRFSLGPDPHAGVWAGGYWPTRVLNAYVRRQGGIPPRRSLLSTWRLNALLREGGFTDVKIFLPDIAHQQKMQFGPALQILINIYGFLKRLPLINNFLLAIGPSVHAVCQKPHALSGSSH